MKPLDVIFAIAVAIVWGMGFVVAKSAMDHFPPIFLMALRFLVTAFCLIWFFPRPKGILIPLFQIALIGSTLQYSLTFNGLAGIDASTAALLVQLEVPFGVLLGYLVFRERITAIQIGGISLAFIGTALIAGEPKLSNSLIHVSLVISGAFVWAVGQIMLKRLGVIGGFTVVTWIAVFATPQLFIASFFLESNQITLIRTAPPDVWLAVAYLGLIMTAAGYAMWYHLLGRYDVSRVMPFLLLLPVAAVIGSIIFLDETLTAKIATGGLLSLLGVALITLGTSTYRVG